MWILKERRSAEYVGPLELRGGTLVHLKREKNRAADLNKHRAFDELELVLTNCTTEPGTVKESASTVVV